MNLSILLRDHATTIIKTQVPLENRQKILDFCRCPEPTPEMWNAVRTLVVDGKSGLRNCTIHQLCARVGLLEKDDLTTVPAPFDVARALKTALTPATEPLTPAAGCETKTP